MPWSIAIARIRLGRGLCQGILGRVAIRLCCSGETLDVTLRIMRQAKVPASRSHQRWMLERMRDLMAPASDGEPPGRLQPSGYQAAAAILRDHGSSRMFRLRNLHGGGRCSPLEPSPPPHAGGLGLHHPDFFRGHQLFLSPFPSGPGTRSGEQCRETGVGLGEQDGGHPARHWQGRRSVGRSVETG